ncbi:MAG: pyridoxamine 5'-phosphate oxidase family protein [Parvibaculum sp.]|nr:pyridoxamine 5'-phosphate oxidase family protein [Parvibaculum sp.]
MAKQFPALDKAQTDFIERQHMFFTASAAATGHINLSPKGLDGLRVIGPNAVVYMDHTGSGNETAALLKQDGRLTIMFCAFDGVPMILRLYGRGTLLKKGSTDYNSLLASAFNGVEPTGARHMIRLDFDLVQTSCGMGVPLYDYKEERASLTRWADAQGQDGLETYRRQKNMISLDGWSTGLADDSLTPAD